MTALAEVVTLYETNASNIADMLRQAADKVATEHEDPEVVPTKAIVAVQIAEDGQIEIYGWGKVDSMEAIATLHLAAAHLIRDRLA